MSARRRRQIVVLAELVLSPRVVVVLAAIVAVALLGVWRNLDPGNPCSPGYREGTTGQLAYTSQPCFDAWRDHRPECVPVPGTRPSAAPFALASCVAITKGARP